MKTLPLHAGAFSTRCFLRHLFTVSSVSLIAIGTPLASGDTTADVIGTVSTRSHVGTGDNVLISGFFIAGDTPKQVLVSVLGASLPAAEALADPTLELFQQRGRSRRFER